MTEVQEAVDATAETTHEQETEAAERPFLVREFAAEFTANDGRTVDVRVVPYGASAQVSDDGGRTSYREEWIAGCFDDQLVAGHRLDVLLNFEHERGIGGLVGKGIALRSEQDGLHGSFRLLQTQDGDKALELVRDGILGGVSLEAYAKKSVRSAEGVVRRVKAHLRNVALCRTPAFKDAVVLALREQTVFEENVLPVEPDPEVIERCRRLGIKLPQRYQAHPAETDTPASAGTSEDGTRQPIGQHTS